MKAMVTAVGRRKMAQARAGMIQLPPICGMAVGSGGTDEQGNEKTPQESGLYQELLRKEIESVTRITDSTYQYEITLLEDELPGETISESGLYDADGDFVAVLTCLPKKKDAGAQMLWQMFDQF